MGIMNRFFAYTTKSHFQCAVLSYATLPIRVLQISPFISYEFRKLDNIFLRIFQNRVIYNVRSNLDNGFLGEVTEWLKVLAWNAGVVKATEGSNPSLTAIIRWTSMDTNILNDGRVPVTVDP